MSKGMVSIQINGKVKERIFVWPGTEEKKIKEIALSNRKIQELIKDKLVKKLVVIPLKLVNIIIEK